MHLVLLAGWLDLAWNPVSWLTWCGRTLTRNTHCVSLWPLDPVRSQHAPWIMTHFLFLDIHAFDTNTHRHTRLEYNCVPQSYLFFQKLCLYNSCKSNLQKPKNNQNMKHGHVNRYHIADILHVMTVTIVTVPVVAQHILSGCWLCDWGIQYHLCNTCRRLIVRVGGFLVAVAQLYRSLVAQARCPGLESHLITSLFPAWGRML